MSTFMEDEKRGNRGLKGGRWEMEVVGMEAEKRSRGLEC
jgi:hypothetical protein